MEKIATFRSPFATKFGVPHQSGIVPELEGEIVFEEGYRIPEALRGLEGFDYIWLIWEFSANSDRGWQPTVRPPRLGGNRSMGVFATRSPFRPNHLGLSSVRISAIDTDRMVIHVKGADLMDGTPIYDIKPYVTYADSHPDARSGFVDDSGWTGLEVVIPDGIAVPFVEEQLQALIHTLSLDPRPHYRQGGDRIYGFIFSGFDIRFKVMDNVLTVVEMVPVNEKVK
ncbi:MAG: tRNA (N6-threonylcarbamoyladenosine(37)-N6)-methyltransferase TrmO [Bacteroidales bacterium]|nr:tRNA (N6-threonylcarbamoyladenosine(37)-N6)-methyltransferase TrmO [Candidatus Cryptobacteroides onthequi]